MNAHINVVPQAGFRNGALRCKIEDVSSRYLDIIALAIKLVWLITKHSFELIHAKLNQTWVSNPTAVIAIRCLTPFVGRDCGKSNCVFLGIVLNGDESAHTTHRWRATLMASF